MSTSTKEVHTRLYEAHGAKVLRPLVARSARDHNERVLGDLGKPSEGIYYVVRLPPSDGLVPPSGWFVYPYRFDELPELDHPTLWKDFVCPWLAQHWCQTLEMPPAMLENRLQPLAYAFPRGRVTRAASRSILCIFHGGDVMSFMGLGNADVGRLFSVTGMARWTRDEQLGSRASDRNAIRELLRLGAKENWETVRSQA